MSGNGTPKRLPAAVPAQNLLGGADLENGFWGDKCVTLNRHERRNYVHLLENEAE